MHWITDAADQLSNITANSTYEEVSTSISEETARAYWAKRNIAANFLKHADWDHSSTLNINELKNEELLVQAVAALSDLIPQILDPEGFTVWLYHCASHDLTADLSGSWKKMADKLSQIDPEDRKRFCYEWIQASRSPT